MTQVPEGTRLEVTVRGRVTEPIPGYRELRDGQGRLLLNAAQLAEAWAAGRVTVRMFSVRSPGQCPLCGDEVCAEYMPGGPELALHCKSEHHASGCTWRETFAVPPGTQAVEVVTRMDPHA